MATVENISKHKTTLGYIYIVISLLNITAVIMIYSIFSGIIPHIGDHEEVIIFSVFKYIITTYMLIMSVAGVITGFGLLKQKEWASYIMLALGILSLPGFPLYTFIGVYSIVVFILDRDEISRKKVEIQD